MIKKKILAFTLAEILIALAVIGVVAALTVPRAMTGTNTKANVVKLKRAYTGIQEALRMASAKAGYDMADITVLGNSSADSHPYNAQDLFATAFDATVRSGSAYSYAVAGNGLSYEYQSDTQYAFSTVTAFDPSSDDENLLFVGRNGAYYYIISKGNSSATGSPDNMANGCTVTAPCILYIDINGKNNKPNRIVTCTSGADATGDFPTDDEDNLDPHGSYTEPEAGTNCTVDDNGVTDIYPFFIYDAEVRPATRAAVAVLEK